MYAIEPIRPYPCLRGLSWNFSSRKRERAARRERKTSGYLGLESRSRETSGTRVIRPSFSWLFVLRMLHVATQSINVELGCIDWPRPNWGSLRKQLRGLRKKKKNKRANKQKGMRPVLHKNRRHQEPKFRVARARKYRRKCLWLSQFPTVWFWAFVIFSSESWKCLTLRPKVRSSAHQGEEING